MSYNQQQQRPPERQVIRIPLTTTQHIAHLLGTVFTFGVWGIVWLIRGLQGNKVWADTQPGYYPPPQYVVPPGFQPPPPYHLGPSGMVQGPPPAPRPPVTDTRTGLQRPEGYQ